MAITTKVEFKDWDLGLTRKIKRNAVRAAGARLASRLRKRLKASGKLNYSGQLIRALQFKLNRRLEAAGSVFFANVREDADTHTRRRPIKNFALAAFHAAKGRTALMLQDADKEFIAEEIRKQFLKALKRHSASELRRVQRAELRGG